VVCTRLLQSLNGSVWSRVYEESDMADERIGASHALNDWDCGSWGYETLTAFEEYIAEIIRTRRRGGQGIVGRRDTAYLNADTFALGEWS
jgi:hypothetical protein